MLAVNILAPFLSLLAGAALTYWLNVRQRRRSYVDDLFNDAIAAVFAAEASVEYSSNVGRPDRLSDKNWQELQDWFTTEGVKNWWSRQLEANIAVARVRAYQPEVADHLPVRVDMTHRDVTPLIEVLRQGPVPR